MTVRRIRLLVPVGIAAVVAVTALSGTGPATASAAAAARSAAVAITHSNGTIAYSCMNENGLSTRLGWVVSDLSGTHESHMWRYGGYGGGVSWAPDGSEMVHTAAVTARLYGHASVTTVFLSEATDHATGNTLSQPFDYPWQDSGYFDGEPSYEITDTTFSGDGRDILFTRSGHVQSIPAAGYDPPLDLPNMPDGQTFSPTSSPTGDIAFVNANGTGPGGGAPWIYILPKGSSTPIALGAGSRPRFSPDGSLIAFVNPSGTLSTMTTTGTSVTAVGPASYASWIQDFVWSPDGTEFLLSEHVAAGIVGTAPVTAGSTFTQLPALASCLRVGDQVSWQPVPTSGHEDQVVRVSGSTRENTSVAVSKAGFPTDGTADAVVLADSYHFPDALSGAPLATFVHGPLLLTPGTQGAALPAIKTEMSRVLGSTSKPIYILGGTGSVSAGIQADLVTAGYTNITRLAGANRYLTSLAIANFMGHDATSPQELLLATGTDFPDGLSAGAAAASYWPGGGIGGAVLLTNGATMVPQVQTYITHALAAQTPTRHVRVTVVGGLADKAYPGTASNKKLRDVGADRYTTSAYVAEDHFGAQTAAAVATGTSFPDALSGGAYAGSINAPLLLLPPSLVSSAYEFNAVPYFLNIASGAISTAYVFGGTGVVTSTQMTQLMKIIGVNTTSSQITPTMVLTAKSRAVTRAAGTAKAAPRSAPRAPARG